MIKRLLVFSVVLLLAGGILTPVYGQAQSADDVRMTASIVRQAALNSTPGTTTSVELQRMADDIDRTACLTRVHEAQVTERNSIIRFFIGGNRTASAALAQAASSYQFQADRLQNLMTALNFNQSLKPLALHQTENLRQEHDRLNLLAEKENQSKGILGFITG